MTISIDSNIIAALWNDHDPLNEVAVRIFGLIGHDRLVVSGSVYSELMAGPLRDEASLDLFFKDTGIEIDWEIGEEVWREAGRAYSGFAKRRKHSGAGPPRRTFTDFLIGAQAVIRGYTLLTLDERLYRASFPKIRVESF
jgi:predicted nucleic acid-binding protein